MSSLATARLITAPTLCSLLLIPLACGGGRPSGRDARPVRFHQPGEPTVISSRPASLLVGTFAGQTGLPELLVVYPEAPWAHLLTADLKGDFPEIQQRAIDLRSLLPTDEPLRIRQALTEDFDRDDSPDLALLDEATGRVHILLNDGRGEFHHRVTLPRTADPGEVVIGFDTGLFDIDDELDFVVATPTQAHFHMRVGSQTQWRRIQRAVPLGGDIRLIVAGDFLLNLSEDLLTVDPGGIGMVRRNRNQIFVPDEERRIPLSDVTAIAPGDLNADQFIDLAVARTAHDEIGLWLMTLDRQWVPNRPSTLGVDAPLAVTCADVNGDDALDLVVACAREGDSLADIRVIRQRP